MKRINKIFGLSLSLAAVFGLASCSNEVGEPANTPDNNDENVVLNLVKTPDVVAYSGSTVYGNPTKGMWTDPETGKAYYIHDDEVEANLSILDVHEKYDVADLVAKLSLHVRHANDVVVTIPLPASYVVESDDLYIFNQHYANDATHKGKYGSELIANLETTTHNITYKVPIYELNDEDILVENGTKDVNLEVSFQENQVVVRVTGIDEEVYNSCKAYNQDGMNFEVYLYLQTSEAGADQPEAVEDRDPRDILKGIFEGEEAFATIKIIAANDKVDELPSYYINSFGYAPIEDADYTNGNVGYTNDVNPYDCKVVLNSKFYSLIEGEFEHLNSSKYNKIYTRLDLDKVDHAHGGSYDPNFKTEE